MSNGHFSEQVITVAGLSPSADLYDGDPGTDVVNMEGFNRAVFQLHQKTGGTNTGTAVVTVLASTAASGGTTAAIPFTYRKKTTGASAAYGAITAATTSGFTTTANEDTIYLIEVEDQALPAGKPYLQLKLTEAVDDPVLGSVTIHLMGGRYKEPYDTVLS